MRGDSNVNAGCGMSNINLDEADQRVFKRLKSTGKVSTGLRRAITQQYNRCSECGKEIGHGHPAFAGYSAANKAILVCAYCSYELVELATPVYWTGQLNLSVEEDVALWRYMDFSKYVAMIQEGGLYFSRASTFNDKFEAAAGIASREHVWNEHYLEYFRATIRTPPDGYPSLTGTEADIDQEASRLLGKLRSAYARARDSLVSCWHINDVESEAQWQIYCSPGAPGVAVRTNIDRLWRAMLDKQHANIGKVQYIDFKTSFASGDQRIYCKRSSLAHEREVRAVLPNDRISPLDGILVKCNLNDLIEQIVISPFAPPWFGAVVRETTSRFGYDFQISASEIQELPFY